MSDVRRELDLAKYSDMLVETEVKYFNQELICPECRDGKMVHDKGNKTTWGYDECNNLHRCNSCNYEIVLPASFPRLIIKEVEKS